MSRDHTSDARGVFRVLETADADLARRVASPAFSGPTAPAAPPAASLRGPAGLLASSAWLRSAFADLHVELLETDGSGSHVWLRLRMQGEQTGPFVQSRTAGRPVCCPRPGGASTPSRST